MENAESPAPPQPRASELAGPEPPPHQHHHHSPNHASSPPSAYSLIRLIQCPRCSRPLRSPLRLPCGNSFCRECLPPTKTRTRITYPATEGRDQGFECYWSGPGSKSKEAETCVGEHCVGDCAVDVLLRKVVGVFDEVLGPGSGSDEEAGRGRGVLERVYGLAKDGKLDYDSFGVDHHQGIIHEGDTVFDQLKDALRTELDCHLCYSLIMDPLTTPCGHSFCRQCVTSVLYHSDLCPICRRKLNIPSNVRSEPMNKRIAGLTESLFPDQVAARIEAMDREESGVGERLLPLFVCTLSFPSMPTFLHVYERRYRNMMRRIMASGERKFGMVTYNRGNRTQGNLGRAPFLQYGTLLAVDRFELLPDGRSLVIGRGLSRFKVTKSEIQDGYHVGLTERIDDVSITEEENREFMETSQAADASASASDRDTADMPLEAMSTQQLFDLGVNFVRKQRNEGVEWLHPRVLLAYGNLPTDPALFPWWFASLFPVPEDDKYALLSTTSVRERLKIIAGSIRKLEGRLSVCPDRHYLDLETNIPTIGPPLVHHLCLSYD